jgi:hypothetical protein
MITIGSAVAAKVFDEIAGATFHTALDRLVARHRAIGREALLEQVRKGKPWAIQDDDAAAAMFAYLRAVQEGAAKANLRMIAEALFNAAQEPTFAPDEFRRHADALAALSRDEILLLAAFIRANKATEGRPGDQTDPNIRAGLVWATILQGGELPGLDVLALAAALGRTGWIEPLAGGGGMMYYTTSAFSTIERLVDFEGAKLEVERVGK